jgi:ribose transport system substrate-binding protein
LIPVLLVVCSILASGAQSAAGETDGQAGILTLDEMRQRVSTASAASLPWSGPRKGPAAESENTIAMICEDLRNGGILGVAQGVQEAGQVLGWQVKVYDAGGTPEGRKRAAEDALDADPDGVILNGADAGIMRPLLNSFAERGIPIVGWHVGPVAGAVPEGPVAMNVATDPLEVARITAMAAIVESGGKAGVIIFTDSNFKIAMAKAGAMSEVIDACAECTLLEIRDVPISGSAERMPELSRKLLTRYGKRWTHGLAINDIYFDYAVPEFILAGPEAQHIRFLSAGDGSSSAFLRIQTGIFQVGTVAEPLNLQGWQLVDELNRLLNDQPVSGFVAPVHLVTPESVMHDGGNDYRYDPDNGYRDIYRQIWGR